MKILAIETSCDETAVAVLEAEGSFENPQIKVLSSTILSQVNLHAEYGGVFPTLAKREHAKNLIPVLLKTLKETNIAEGNPLQMSQTEFSEEITHKLEKILEREPELLKQFIGFIPKIKIPDIDVVAVTQGPGLAPALWVGLNFAKALSIVWNKPLIPINHMEGHILSVLINRKKFLIPNTKIQNIDFPAIALLISGGHTQLVLVKNWMDYKILGQTRDDAVGEAFDKVARMLGLPYPGGPEISKLADETRRGKYEPKWNLPRPMINTKDYDFSFSGLKTAVLYTIQKINFLSARRSAPGAGTGSKTLVSLKKETKQEIAREFEDAVVEILIKKTKKALQEYNVKTLIIGGGVSANKEIRKNFEELAKKLSFERSFLEEEPELVEGDRKGETLRKIKLLLPEKELSTDNAVMIGIAGYFRYLKNAEVFPVQSAGNSSALNELKADGNLRL